MSEEKKISPKGDGHESLMKHDVLDNDVREVLMRHFFPSKDDEMYMFLSRSPYRRKGKGKRAQRAGVMKKRAIDDVLVLTRKVDDEIGGMKENGFDEMKKRLEAMGEAVLGTLLEEQIEQYASGIKEEQAEKARQLRERQAAWNVGEKAAVLAVLLCRNLYRKSISESSGCIRYLRVDPNGERTEDSQLPLQMLAVNGALLCMRKHRELPDDLAELDDKTLCLLFCCYGVLIDEALKHPELPIIKSSTGFHSRPLAERIVPCIISKEALALCAALWNAGLSDMLLKVSADGSFLHMAGRYVITNEMCFRLGAAERSIHGLEKEAPYQTPPWKWKEPWRRR